MLKRGGEAKMKKMVKTRKKKPEIYFDTPIIRDCMKLRNADSIYLLKTAIENKWKIVTSTFSIMELIDTEKDDRFFIKKLGDKEEINKIVRFRYTKDLAEDDLDQILNGVVSFFELYDIEYRELTDIGWNNAFQICHGTNLSATDSIHFAIGLAYDVIVTTDEFFIKAGRKYIEKYELKAKICKPSEVMKILKQIGFKI